MIENPLFIVGSERSGSNLLRVILNELPEVAIPHPPHLLRDLAPLITKYGDLSEDRNLRKLIDHAENLVDLHFAPWPFALDKDEIFDEASQILPRDPYVVYALIYEQYKEHVEKKRWGCKSTFMIRNVDQILRYHKAPQFIHLVRDGRDVAVSAKKSIFSHYHPYFVAHLWRQEQALAMDWSARLPKETWLTVRYEDLIAQPEAEVKRICAFLKEPFSTELLKYADKSTAQSLSRMNRSWENIAQPVLKDNSQKFLREMEPEDRKLFESVAARELKHFGYLPAETPSEIRKLSSREKLSFTVSEKKSWLVEETKGLLHDRNSLLRWRKKIYLKYLKYTL